MHLDPAHRSRDAARVEVDHAAHPAPPPPAMAGALESPKPQSSGVRAALETSPFVNALRFGAAQATQKGIYFVTAAQAAVRSWFRSISSLFRAPAWQRYEEKPVQLPASFPAPERRAPPSDLPAAVRGMAFSEAHDIHYDGHWCIPGRDDAVVDFEAVLQRDDWPDFIRAHLTEGESTPEDPLRIFFPGLNTPLADAQPRIPYYVEVTGLPMAQIANGATTDLGDLTLTLPGRTDPIVIPGNKRDWIQAMVQRFNYSPGALTASLAQVLGAKRNADGKFTLFSSGDGAAITLDPQELTRLANALKELGDPNQRLMDHMSRLLMAHIDRDDAPPLEIMAYSESTIVLGRVLDDLEARYIATTVAASPDGDSRAIARTAKEKFRARLDRITFLTVGTGWRDFPAGYKTLHLYGWGENPDKLTAMAGPWRIRAPRDLGILPFNLFTGGDEGLLPYEHPFPGFDAHNFLATGSHALREYLEHNASTTLRELWDRHRRRAIVRPSFEDVARRIDHNDGESHRWHTGPLG